MANFKRRKCRRSIRPALCTPHRLRGNNRDRFKPRERAARERAGE